MKVLLDESVPRQLGRFFFPDDFEVYTVQEMGWSGRANGDLLRLARSHGFKALVTVDQGFEYQQNLEHLLAPVIVMLAPSVHLQASHPLIPKVISVLSGNPRRQISRVSA